MTRRQQWILVAAIVSLIAVGVTAATQLLDDNLYDVKVGSRAPAFSATTLLSPPETRTLADYRGRVVLLNVWATWCEPCKIEMPSMEQLHREFGDRGLSIVAVSVDPSTAQNQIRKFVTDLGLTFDILHEPTGALQKAYNSYGYPESFVIDRRGVITRLVYPDDWFSSSNRALIAHLIGEGSDPIPPPPKSAAIRVAGTDTLEVPRTGVLGTDALTPQQSQNSPPDSGVKESVPRSPGTPKVSVPRTQSNPWH